MYGVRNVSQSGNVNLDSIGAYLREIGRIPMLTAEQEIQYARTIQAWLTSPAAKKAEDELSPAEQKAFRGYIRAKQRMIDANLRLVVSVAKKYWASSVPMMDLIQEGSIGMQRAAEKFDPTKGYKFSTYAHWWIRQAITRAIAEQGRVIRLPVHLVEKIGKINKYSREFQREEGRKPTVAEIAAHMEMAPTQVQQILDDGRDVGSLNRLIPGLDNEKELIDCMEAPEPEPDERAEMLKRIEQLSWRLTPMEKRVMHLRYGLETGETMKIAEIAAVIDQSPRIAKVLNQRAMRKIRAAARYYGLESAIAI
jgi:RNA polymerase nonessential primary-like sigma factor